MLERDHAADRRMAETGRLLKYLPCILLYPLTGQALLTTLLLSTLLWFGVQSIFGVIILAVSAPWTFHYAEGVIEETARGRATPPPFRGEMIFLGSNLGALRPLVGVALAVYGWDFARDYGPGAEIAALGLAAFLFPAFMLVVTVENSVLSALNPAKLFQAIVGVGVAYLALCLVLTLAAAGVVLAVRTGAPGMGLGATLSFGAIFVSIYLWLMTFHLLGYVAFHRAEQLGLPVKTPAVTEATLAMERQAARLAAVLRNVDAALAAKDLDAAGRALTADPGGPADARLFHEELFEEIQHARRRNVALVHLQGQRLISLLVREKRVPRALDVAETCFDAHPDFQPETPEHAVVLAEAALQAKREGLFRRLTGDREKRYAGTPTLVSLQFLAARHAYEHGRDEARARELLAPLLAHSTHPRHRQIAAYAKALGMS